MNVVAEVRWAKDDTPRANSPAESLNSRLRKYFFLRRHPSEGCLSLLQFFLNHRTFLRSRRARRVGKSPTELLTGRPHAHWLALARTAGLPASRARLRPSPQSFEPCGLTAPPAEMQPSGAAGFCSPVLPENPAN